MTRSSSEIARIPWVRALDAIGPPYLAPLSRHSDLEVWHVDLEFRRWDIPLETLRRWEDNDANNRDTWRKRPLAIGEASGCAYSCGEVEIAARLRKAGFHARWVSEWSGYAHVDCWRPFCVRRSELENEAPGVWAFDRKLRARAAASGIELGPRGGHPDVAGWKTGVRDYFFIEYKGPGDTIRPKQDAWARAVLEQHPAELPYVAAKGVFLE